MACDVEARIFLNIMACEIKELRIGSTYFVSFEFGKF